MDGTNKDGEPLATRETELGRIHLALGVFHGLRDLHEGDGTTSDKEWLPIVHANLQAKQYLVDLRTGRIYLKELATCFLKCINVLGDACPPGVWLGLRGVGHC